ncbi:hypothetical protein [Demequina gelatinilytica]|uniref:hypothetical protein n=1 Tax=Demequina gelatinilytica TaxID=1638980 RepID=UPI0007808FD0|nr:hypothetical protein [Demequina gelatinilytica]
MARGFNYAPGTSDEVEEAASADLSKERMQELGSSRNAVVRETLAGRPDCPFGLMVTLAHDSAAPVRCALAANPRVLHSLLENLARDKQESVLLAVARNPVTGAELLDALAGSRKESVRAAAVAALDARDRSGRADARDTPELRDRVFEESHARREAMLAAAMVPAEPVTAAAPRPVRTAPVRGFLPPSER